jgi:hypothetical protein
VYGDNPGAIGADSGKGSRHGAGIQVRVNEVIVSISQDLSQFACKAESDAVLDRSTKEYVNRYVGRL